MLSYKELKVSKLNYAEQKQRSCERGDKFKKFVSTRTRGGVVFMGFVFVPHRAPQKKEKSGKKSFLFNVSNP